MPKRGPCFFYQQHNLRENTDESGTSPLEDLIRKSWNPGANLITGFNFTYVTILSVEETKLCTRGNAGKLALFQ